MYSKNEIVSTYDINVGFFFLHTVIQTKTLPTATEQIITQAIKPKYTNTKPPNPVSLGVINKLKRIRRSVMPATTLSIFPVSGSALLSLKPV